MSERQNDSYSIDDIINSIKEERIKKASIAAQSGEMPASYGAKRTEKPLSDDDLVNAYLPSDRREEAGVAQARAQRTRVAAPVKTDRSAPPKSSNASYGTDDGQLSFEGFEDDFKPRKVSEDQEEQALLKRRRQRIDRFRMFSEGMEDEALQQKEQKERRRGAQRSSLVESVEPKTGQGLFDAVDGVQKKKKRTPGISFSITDAPAETAQRLANERSESKAATSIKKQRKHLLQIKTKSYYTCLILGCVFGVMFILALLPGFYTEGGALSGFLGGTGRVYLTINLILTILATVAGFDALRSSFISIVQLSPNADAAAVVAILFALLQNIVLLIKGDFTGSGGVLYGGAAVFMLLLNCVSKYLSACRMLGNLKTIAKNRELSSVMSIENRADANQLAYGLSLNDTPGIIYCSEAQMPDNFFELSSKSKGEEKFFGYAVPVVLILGAVVGIIGAFSAKSVIGFITSFTGCLCMCLPGCVTFLSNLLIYRTNALSNKSGGAILGFDGICDIDKTNAVIVDTKDIFYGEMTGFRNIKTYYKMSIEDAVKYAGAVLVKGDGILADIFADVAREQGINLPAVEELRYEDRLGFSAWVNGLRVLVGNENMMLQHNVPMNGVELPEENPGGRTCHMYVAVEGKLAAAFDVTYSIGKNAARQIKRLTDNGVVLMVMTRDCAVTEQLVSKCARVNADLIKVASSKSRDIMRMYNDNSAIRRKRSSILFRPGVGSQLRIINAAFKLVDTDRQAFLIQFAGLIFGAGLCIALNLLNTASILGSVFVVIYQLIWIGLSLLISNSKFKTK